MTAPVPYRATPTSGAFSFHAKKIVLTAVYARVSDVAMVVSAIITCPSTNAGPVYIKGDDAADVPMAPGDWYPIKHVDLNELEVKGTVGDVLTVIGGTW